MLNVFIAGLESSGNHWIRSALAQHPHLKIEGDSFPSGWCNLRHYPAIPDCDVLIIITRDANAHRASVIRMGYERDNEGKFTDAESVEIMARAASTHPRVVFVSYESALMFRQVYWDWVFKCIGVPPVKIETEYNDGNKKYYK